MRKIFAIHYLFSQLLRELSELMCFLPAAVIKMKTECVLNIGIPTLPFFCAGKQCVIQQNELAQSAADYFL